MGDYMRETRLSHVGPFPFVLGHLHRPKARSSMIDYQIDYRISYRVRFVSTLAR